MKITQKPVEKVLSLPMEDFLGIAPETTVITRTERETELSKPPEYDEKDDEIEQGYQEVIDKSISGYERLLDEIDTAEGRVIPRLSEVAVAHLNTALAAVSAKAKLKEHKDKLVKKAAASGGKTVNNTVIIANREEVLQSILQKRDQNKNIITVEHTQIEGEINDKK